VKEQRANIKFCFKTGKTSTDTFQLIKQAYGDNDVSHLWVFKWYLNGLNDLKSSMRIFRMIQEAGVLQPLEMQMPMQSQMSLKSHHCLGLYL
jgi:hypothetical protein